MIGALASIKQPSTHYKPSETKPAIVADKNLTASTENSLVISSKMADYVPVPLPEQIEPVKIILSEKARAALSMKKNILQTIQHIPSFIKQDSAEQLLSYAAQKEPDELFKKIDDSSEVLKSETTRLMISLTSRLMISLNRLKFGINSFRYTNGEVSEAS